MPAQDHSRSYRSSTPNADIAFLFVMNTGKVASLLIIVVASVSILYWTYSSHTTETTTHQIEQTRKKVIVASDNGDTSLAKSRGAVNKPPLDADTNAEELLSASMDAIRDNDQRAGTLLALLTNALRRNTEENAYILIQESLFDETLGKDEKKALVGVLGEARTYEALLILLAEEERIRDEELRAYILKKIMRAGDLTYGYFAIELSPLLEEEWRNTNQEELLRAVGVPMSKIGARGGINAIMEVLNNPDDYSLRKVEIAENLIPNMFNEDATETLTKYCTGYDLNNKALVASGYGLAYVGAPEAAYAIVDWAANAPMEAKDMINEWADVSRGGVVADEEWHEKFMQTVAEKKFKHESIKENILNIWEGH